MNKITSLFIVMISLMLFSILEVQASNDDYKTFNEIIMSSGKLLRYFTKEELDEYKSKLKKKFIGVDVYVVNKNVEATYISETLYNVCNSGNTNVEYQLDIEVQKSEKITWEVSGNLSAAAKGTIKMFQVNLESEVGVNYKNISENSIKETEKLDLTIEPNSRAIIYLMGRARVTNGVAKVCICFIDTAVFGFEYFTIINQYPRLEKRSLC